MKKVVNLSLKINSCLKSGQLSLKIDGCLFQYTKNKQPLSDFQAQIGADPKQPEAQLENGVAYKKTCSRVIPPPPFPNPHIRRKTGLFYVLRSENLRV